MKRWLNILIPLSFTVLLGATLNAQTIRESVRLAPMDLAHPLQGELYVSGTFGEPRPNHYHAGLDLKTGGKIGMPVKVVDDGYLARIKVSAGGYGKALYINHPSGLTSVYAHLESFSEPVASLVRKWQYERQSFELDTVLTKKSVKYVKGDVIALSGNTGGSSGPHLHFEIRETVSGLAINPMRFFDQIKDTQAPITGSVRIYSYRNSIYESSPTIVQPVMKDGQLTADVLTQEGRLCVSVEAFDQQDLTPEHKNGIPILRMYEDGKLLFYRKTDSINFNLTRYAHALIDYGANLRTGTDHYLFCRLPGNKEDNPHQFSPGNGILEIKAGKKKEIRLELEDFHGNVSTINLIIQAKDATMTRERLLDSTGSVRSLQLAGALLEWKDDTWYDQPIYDIQIRKPLDADKYSPIYSLFMQTLPAIHASLSFKLKSHSLPKALQNKGVIVHENYKGSKKALKTSYAEGIFSANINEPGHLHLSVDTMPPTISLLNFNEATSKFSNNQIICKINDDLSGVQTYRGTIDGQWILMDYDAKTGTLSYIYDEKCPLGEHQFQLVVTDARTNSQTFIHPFKN